MIKLNISIPHARAKLAFNWFLIRSHGSFIGPHLWATALYAFVTEPACGRLRRSR